MEDSNSNSKFDEIFEQLSQIEKEGKIEYKATFDWVNSVSQPEEKLISNLINELFDPETKDEIKEKILHTFNVFLRVSNQFIKDQIWEKRVELAGLLCCYLSESDKSELIFDCVNIIVNIYQAQFFTGFIDEKFIKCIFDGLNLIEDEETLICSIGILIEINSEFTNVDQNPFIAVYHSHENSRVFNEVLLKILNMGVSQEMMYKIFYCLNCIMEREEKCVFYQNDLKAFIDIVLVILQTTYKDELKMFVLESLEKITSYDDYYTEMYKFTELTDLMEDYSGREDQSDLIREKSQMVLKIMSNKMKTKLNNGEEVHEEEEEEEEEESEEEEEGDDKDKNLT